MMQKTIGVCLLAWAGIFAFAGVQIAPNGMIRFGEKGELTVRHYHPKWRTSVPHSKIAGMTADGGKIQIPWILFDETKAEFEEKITKEKDTYQIEYLFRSRTPAKTAILAAELALPVKEFLNTPLKIDGKEFFFAAQKDAVIHKKAKVRHVEWMLPDGLVRIDFPTPVFLEVQDARHWNKNVFNMRFYFTPEAGSLTESRLTMNLRFTPLQSRAIDFQSKINRTFDDPVPSDGAGGWTDQGPNNDMRVLPRKPLCVGTLKFPVSADGCIAVGGRNRKGCPQRVLLPMNGESYPYLALLHAGAWLPGAGTQFGQIVASYQDGSSQSIPVISGKDVGNWWVPAPLSNGAVVWRGSNPSSAIGLYCSFFPLAEKPLKSLCLEATGENPLWLTVSMLLTTGRMNFPRQEPYKITRNGEWRAFSYDRSVREKSALDFSFLLDAPAGKHGFVQVTQEGAFQFEKQKKPVRFYGTNISFWALYMSKRDCDMIAGRLARCGYNAVRLHHFDRDLVDRSDRKDSHRILAERLDQLDYLIAALKKKGIYITTDLYTARYPAPEEFPTLPKMAHGYEYKAMVMISPEVRAKFKEWVRKVLTHRNPYTNLSWAEDPAFIGISILNENSIFFIIEQRCGARIRDYYRNAFEQRCRERGIAVTEANRNKLFHQFCEKLYQEYYQEMVKFLRELGVRAPLTDQNFMESPNYNSMRRNYDYVDNHIYWDHPVSLGTGLTPMQFSNDTALRNRLHAPRLIMPTRIWGKPFTVTEFNFCYPNRYRAEGAPLFGAYAALQDWNAIYRFGYSGGKDRALTEVSIEAFDCANDVIQMLSERIGMAFFLRGDVKPSEKFFSAAVPADVVSRQWPEYPMDLQLLGLYGQVGSVECDRGRCIPALPKGTNAVFALTSDAVPAAGKIPVFRGFHNLSEQPGAEKILPGANPKEIRSSTGELVSNFGEQTFTAVTKASEAFILPQGKHRKGEMLSARAKHSFAVVSVIAVDGSPLKKSNRLLVLHLTDVQMEGITFDNPDQRIVIRWPKGQLVAKKGVAEIRLALPEGGWKLYALDASGKRVAELSLRREKNALNFLADTFQVPGEVIFAYELEKSPAAH
ncbi:MAG: hypothetical protein PHS41_06565 [Victivallaceae bacterium]|nr:hypothetical protein [Victivallaceae bacterium]